MRMHLTLISPTKRGWRELVKAEIYMKFSTPEIVWHSKEPVFSADFHHAGELWRLATGGADKDVKIWKVVRAKEGRNVKLVFLASLSRHTGCVNVVRFSPNGELLASAGDDNVVCLWKMDEAGEATGNIAMDTSTESWSVTKILKGHLEDIYDACWSANSSMLVTGSVDNTAIVWDILKGQALCTLIESKQYVQGVAWDPIGQYLATLSNDRYLRIYSTDHKYKCIHTIAKTTVSDHERGKPFRMWIDETLSSFFRRLTFSPDGNLLVVPAGRLENGEKITNTTYIFTKTNLTKPAVSLPCPEKATVVVKFCPVLFKLRDSIEKDKCLFSLPYRMVYAVASVDSVLLYDTQQSPPFAYLSNMHYSCITDLAWSDDGLVLVVTSSDAYCSIVTFEPGELGIAMETENLPESKNIGTTVGAKDGEKNKLTEEVVAKKKIVAGLIESGSDGGDVVKGRNPIVGSKVNGDTTGEVKEVAKGNKRRIQATLVKSFTSPSNSDLTHTSSSLATAQQSIGNETGLSGLTSTTGNETSHTGLTSIDETSTSIVKTNTESETVTSCPKMKTRRIQLSSVPLQSSSSSSHDSQTMSHDLDHTHSLNTPKSTSEDVELMDIPITE